MLRFNCIQLPFDKSAVRGAVLDAVNQTEAMEAYSGDQSMWRVKPGAFCPRTPMASDAGIAALFGAVSKIPNDLMTRKVVTLDMQPMELGTMNVRRIKRPGRKRGRLSLIP